jgi:hypothetical protein
MGLWDNNTSEFRVRERWDIGGGVDSVIDSISLTQRTPRSANGAEPIAINDGDACRDAIREQVGKRIYRPP